MGIYGFIDEIYCHFLAGIKPGKPKAKRKTSLPVKIAALHAAKFLTYLIDREKTQTAVP